MSKSAYERVRKFKFRRDPEELEAILDWCRRNEKTPLTDAYILAATLVTPTDETGFIPLMVQLERVMPMGHAFGFHDKIMRLGFEARDRIGTVILMMIRKEATPPC
ncbi:MAG: hypothetical protein HY749_16060 [Gammaproteobacteria bacterium]|nr:hypothetical protein [Gammaproteobacteria bacterium]